MRRLFYDIVLLCRTSSKLLRECCLKAGDIILLCKTSSKLLREYRLKDGDIVLLCKTGSKLPREYRLKDGDIVLLTVKKCKKMVNFAKQHFCANIYDNIFTNEGDLNEVVLMRCIVS